MPIIRKKLKIRQSKDRVDTRIYYYIKALWMPFPFDLEKLWKMMCYDMLAVGKRKVSRKQFYDGIRKLVQNKFMVVKNGTIVSCRTTDTEYIDKSKENTPEEE